MSPRILLHNTIFTIAQDSREGGTDIISRGLEMSTAHVGMERLLQSSFAIHHNYLGSKMQFFINKSSEVIKIQFFLMNFHKAIFILNEDKKMSL